MTSPFKALEELHLGYGSFKDEKSKRRKNARQMHAQDERGKPGKMNNWIGDSIRVRQRARVAKGAYLPVEERKKTGGHAKEEGGIV